MPEPHTAADNVSRVAKLGKMDVEDSQTETMPGLQAIHDLGSEDKKSKGGKAMTDRANLALRLRAAVNAVNTTLHKDHGQTFEEAIAALEAKPEPEQTCICADNNRTWRCVAYIPTLPEEEDFRCANCLHDRECHEQKSEPAKPLPESVDAWINSHAESVSDYSKTWWIKESDIRAYIASLHSQHQAELELLRSKLALVLRENRRLVEELKKEQE